MLKRKSILYAILSASALIIATLTTTTPASATTYDTGSHFVSEAITNPYTGETPGWHQDDFGKFYVDSKGDRLNNGLRWIDGNPYYFQPWGYCANDEWVKKGVWYYATPLGNGGCVLAHNQYIYIDQGYYYFNGDCSMFTGLKEYAWHRWNYFRPDSGMVATRGWYRINGQWYGIGFDHVTDLNTWARQPWDHYTINVGAFYDPNYNACFYGDDNSGIMQYNRWIGSHYFANEHNTCFSGYDYTQGEMVWEDWVVAPSGQGDGWNYWYKMDYYGNYQTGWQYANNKAYFMSTGYSTNHGWYWPAGSMVYGDWSTDGCWLNNDANDGYMWTNAWVTDLGQCYWVQGNGYYARSCWLQLWCSVWGGNYWYWFWDNGAMAHGQQLWGETWAEVDYQPGNISGYAGCCYLWRNNTKIWYW